MQLRLPCAGTSIRVWSCIRRPYLWSDGIRGESRACGGSLLLAFFIGLTGN